MPIPCVDVIVGNAAGKVLLVRRANEPARGEWWFPGGRVHFGEPREAAARRKLAEECGVEITTLREVKTADVILPLRTASHARSHAISTLYRVEVGTTDSIRLDAQSSEFAWKTPTEWRQEQLHPFVREQMESMEADRAEMR